MGSECCTEPPEGIVEEDSLITVMEPYAWNGQMSGAFYPSDQGVVEGKLILGGPR